MTDILDPISVINSLFGSIFLFMIIVGLGYFWIAAKYKWNLQMTIWFLAIGTAIFGTVLHAWQSYISFIIILIAGLLSYTFQRFFSYK